MTQLRRFTKIATGIKLLSKEEILEKRDNVWLDEINL